MKGHVITNVALRDPIERFRAGDALTAERLNALVDAVNALTRAQTRDGFTADAALAAPAARRRPFEVYGIREADGKVFCSIAPGGIFGESGSDPRASWFFPGADLQHDVAGDEMFYVVVKFSEVGDPVYFNDNESWLETVSPSEISISASLMNEQEYRGDEEDDIPDPTLICCAVLSREGAGGWKKKQILHGDFFVGVTVGSGWEYFNSDSGEDQT